MSLNRSSLNKNHSRRLLLDNPYGDWTSTPPEPTPTPAAPAAPESSTYGGSSNTYGSSSQSNSKYSSKGFSGGKPEFKVINPGRYLPVAVHIGKDIPPQSRELLEMMLRTLEQCEYTIRVATTNDAFDIIKLNTGLERVEYVRPWSKFEADPIAMGDKGWYPSMAVNKSCEILLPKMMADDNKARPFRILEAAMIMGRAGKQTARALITYSPDGITNHLEGGKESGYMQNIIRVAQMYGITVINVGASDAREKFGKFITPFNLENHRE
jgi:hypothetical protein